MEENEMEEWEKWEKMNKEGGKEVVWARDEQTPKMK